MKANEFVKMVGWEEARGILEAESFTYRQLGLFSYINHDLDDLKRLVESHELVERVISDHNKSFRECQIDIHGLKSFVKKNPKIYPKRLKQAIEDVESCQ